MQRRSVIVAGAIGAFATLAGAVWGQSSRLRAWSPHGHGGFGRFGAHHALEELGLSEEQKTQIHAILRSHRDELRAALERLHGIHESVRQASSPEAIDEAAIRSAVAGAAEPLADLAVLHARAYKEIVQVLTPEQRAKADAWHGRIRDHLKRFHQHFEELGEHPKGDRS